MDSSYTVTYLSHTENIWTYEVTEPLGGDLASWGLGIGSCLDEAVGASPAAMAFDTGGFSGLEWDVDGGFSSGIFTFELNGEYPPHVVQAMVTTGQAQSATADIIGPDCSGDSGVGGEQSEQESGVCLATVDFETDAAGNPLLSGQLIENEWEAWGIHVTTSSPADHPAMIFDSANPTGGDPDLGTPNEDFGGLGEGDGGRAGMPGENSQPLGNILIISEDNDASDPDDNGSGGAISFTYDMPVRLDEVYLVDIKTSESGVVNAYGGPGGTELITSVSMLGLGDNSSQLLAIDADGVTRLDVEFTGSGGLEAVVSCRDESPLLYTIGGRIWHDTNGDGIQDTGEAGIAGVGMQLRIPGMSQVVADTTTDSVGAYQLPALSVAGDYVVSIVDEFFGADQVLEGATFSPMDVGSDDTLDSDFNSSTEQALVVLSEDGGDELNVNGGLVLADDKGLPTTALMYLPGDAGACLPSNLDFEMDATGSPLVRGQIIDDEWAEWGVTVTTNSPGSHPAMIFDSANPTGGDPDLGTPNGDFGGPGQGDGGRADVPGRNSQSLGNILIITEDYDMNDPDDNGGGGTVTFTFDTPTRIDVVQMIDVDHSESGVVNAYGGPSGDALITSVKMLGLGDNSYQLLPVNADGVTRLDVQFSGSGGLQSVVSCQDVPSAFYTIGGRIWSDTNGDGIQDAGEPNIPDVDLELYIPGMGQVVADMTTDSNGAYEISTLSVSGDYEVSIAASNFLAGGVLAGAEFSPMDVGSDDTVDSDFDGNTRIANVNLSGGDQNHVDGGFTGDIDVPPVTEDPPPSDNPCTNFRWVDWDGGVSSNMELKQDIEVSSRSGAWHVTDLIPSALEMSDSTLIQTALSSKIGETVTIPLSDETGSGNDVCGFSKVRLVSYTTSDEKHFLTFEFVKDMVRSLSTDGAMTDYGARDIRVLQ